MTALTAMAMLALFCLFSGTGATLSPVTTALPAVILLPILSLAYFRNRADIKGIMSASGFVGRGALDKRFLIRAFTQGLCASLAVLVFRLLLWDESAEVLNACFLASITGALIGAVFVNLSSSIPCYRLIFGKCTSALIIMGATFLLVLLLIYLPGVNAALGLKAAESGALSLLRFIPAFLLGIISQSWVELPKIRDDKS
jgi:hypothetical protein